DAYLDYVEQHAEAYVALMRGGIGADNQVRDIVDETRTVVVGRVLAGFPLDDSPGALLRLTVRGWVGLVEAASLDWLERRDTPRWKLRDLLVGSLVALIAVAADVDPGAFRQRDPMV
ncbi:MAG: TetR/AcrR family transcriptional regulator, partial [Actinomycetota bacterium]|nr:TetR/AcrR family transcriptional regulator [Actinomycetota bacterium]